MDKLEAKSYCILGNVEYKFVREFEGQDRYLKQNYTCKQCKVGLISLIPAVEVWRLVTYHSKEECHRATKELIKKYHQHGEKSEWKCFTLRALQDIPEEMEEVSEILEPVSTSEDDSSCTSTLDPTVNSTQQELHSESSEYLEPLSMSENESPSALTPVPASKKRDSLELHRENLTKRRDDFGSNTPVVERSKEQHSPFMPTPKPKKTTALAPIVVQIPWSTPASKGQHDESSKAKPKQTLMARMKEKVFQPKATNSMEVFSAKKWGEHPLEKAHQKHLEVFKEARAKVDKVKQHFSSKR